MSASETIKSIIDYSLRELNGLRVEKCTHVDNITSYIKHDLDRFA